MKNTYTVITTAPKTLIERYNHALRNPEGSLRITMPEPNRNKDKTIKNVLIEWEDGSDTFTRAELQELGVIQKTKGGERYVAKLPPKKEIVGVNAAMDKAVEAFRKKNPEATERELQTVQEEARNKYLKETPIEKEPEVAAPVAEVVEEKDPATMEDNTEEYNDFVDKYVKKKAADKRRIRKDGKKQKVTEEDLANSFRAQYEDFKKTYQEAAKPDFLDMDKDGDKKEPMKKAIKDKK